METPWKLSPPSAGEQSQQSSLVPLSISPPALSTPLPCLGIALEFSLSCLYNLPLLILPPHSRLQASCFYDSQPSLGGTSFSWLLANLASTETLWATPPTSSPLPLLKMQALLEEVNLLCLPLPCSPDKAFWGPGQIEAKRS